MQCGCSGIWLSRFMVCSPLLPSFGLLDVLEFYFSFICWLFWLPPKKGYVGIAVYIHNFSRRTQSYSVSI